MRNIYAVKNAQFGQLILKLKAISMKVWLWRLENCCQEMHHKRLWILRKLKCTKLP